MTQERDEQRMTLAGELALGLLTGDDLREAAALAASDPAFAEDVARWRGRTIPLLDEVEPVAPPAGLWRRIEGRVAGEPGANVIVLKRRVGLWRGATAGMTALAASLALVLLLQPRSAPLSQPTQVAGAESPMVAMLGNDQKQMKVVASWDPRARQLVLVVPGDMPADPSHAHELWVIPADGKPRSLGTMPARRQMHMQLADALAELMREGATIAITVEPPGGSPTGDPTGPIVASGKLENT